MIKNEREYRITKAQVDRFALALEDVSSPTGDRMRKIQRDAIASQLEDLRAALREYDDLRSGAVREIRAATLDELPTALIRARIARGMSQRDLAERISVKEQQIQKYEATSYAGASLGRLQEVVRALGVELQEAMILPASPDARSLMRRLETTGLGRDFIARRLAPPEVTAKKVADLGEGALVQFLGTLERVFKWSSGQILGGEMIAPTAALARFKVSASVERKSVAVYTVYAQYLALTLLEACRDLPVAPVPRSAKQLRAAVVGRYGHFDYRSALQFVWDLGIPVLPLADPGTFHAACWRSRGRNVIVLKQRTHSLSRWLFDLIHELEHAGADPDLDQFAWIDIEAGMRKSDPAEVRAMHFAGDAVLDGRAEQVATAAVEQAGGRLEFLKTAIPLVAKREGVAVDALANYLAFRLSLQGENWWGAANNLQPQGEDPWAIARDVLLERIDLGRLAEPDRALLQRAFMA